MATTVFHSSTSCAAAPTRRISVSSVAAATLDKLFVWQARFEQRQQLKGMEAHLLNDMGLSHSDVDREISKPFWQA